MRRYELQEAKLRQLADLAADAGVSLRVAVDLDGEAIFIAGALGTFAELAPLEHALDGALRAAA